MKCIFAVIKEFEITHSFSDIVKGLIATIQHRNVLNAGADGGL